MGRKHLQIETIFSDNVMKALEPRFIAASERIIGAINSSRPILLRYNNDADGICGGIALYRAITKLLTGRGATKEEMHQFFREFQNNSAVYELGYASGDILLLRGISDLRPLILLVDFGANAESVEGLKTARDERAEIIMIDHHPYSAKALEFIDVFVSPWAVEGGSSHYTAGMLAGEVAKRIARVDVEELQRIALIGDKSILQQPEEQLKKKALVLDYLADSAKPRNTLSKCETILADAVQLDDAYRQAVQKLTEAVEAVKKDVKTRELENGFVIAIADLNKRLENGVFPPKGKVVGALHDELAAKETRPLVTLGKGQDAITFRANAAAKAAGFNASHIIDEIKNEIPNAITSGGGHDVAASMRLSKGFRGIVLEEVVKKIAAIKR